MDQGGLGSAALRFVFSTFPLGAADVSHHGLVEQSIGRWRCYRAPDMSVSEAPDLVLLGLAADVTSAEPVTARQLSETYSCGGMNALVDQLDRVAGRYLVAVADGSQLHLVPDGWGSLHAYWASAGGEAVVSSWPGLPAQFDSDASRHRDPNRRSPGRQPELRATEYQSVGDRCPLTGARRLPANHWVELPSARIRPLPLEPRPADALALTEEIGNAIVGLQRAAGRRPQMPITAGVDSRWLALAAHNAGIRPDLFTFVPAGAGSTADATIGAVVAERLGLAHEVVELPAEVSRSVRDEVVALTGEWRDLPKMAEIEYLARRPDRPFIVNGNGGEIVRGRFYGRGPLWPGRRSVEALCLGPRPDPHDAAGFERWYRTARNRGVARGGALHELFYWEQRMGQWGSAFYAEKSIAADELSPYCCRRFLRSGPALVGRGRQPDPASMLAADLLLAGIPFNPHESTGLLRRYALGRASINLTRRLVGRGSSPALSLPKPTTPDHGLIPPASEKPRVQVASAQRR